MAEGSSHARRNAECLDTALSRGILAIYQIQFFKTFLQMYENPLEISHLHKYSDP